METKDTNKIIEIFLNDIQQFNIPIPSSEIENIEKLLETNLIPLKKSDTGILQILFPNKC